MMRDNRYLAGASELLPTNKSKEDLYIVSTSIGHQRLYKTLCRVLDSLCEEGPPSIPIYHAAPGNQDSLIQARSRALLHLFLKARFGLVDFSQREKYITDGPQDGGIDAYYIDPKAKKIYVLQSKFRASAGNLVSTNMSADDLLKMDVSRILKGERRDEKGNYYNEQIIKGKEVLLRVITFVGPKKPDMEEARLELIGDISRASNSQTKIEESDRRSNDEIQIKLQDHFYETYGLYYERKRGEFADGIRSGYISKDQIVNREKVIRIALAAEYRVNQARSSVSKYFEETKLNLLLKVKDVSKYAYGYEVMRLLDARRKSKPKSKGDRYHTKECGQALRYGQYAVAAVCINLGLSAKKLEEPMLNAVLKDWIKFEVWAESRSSNIAYTSKGSFDFVNYYKGSTINSDLQDFSFSA